VPVRVSAAAALAIALILPTSAAGAVKTGFDRDAGMRLTLDGRVLTAKIANSRGGDLDLEKRLYGRRIDAVCGSSFLYPEGPRWCGDSGGRSACGECRSGSAATSRATPGGA
jgi:hypothetical protein